VEYGYFKKREDGGGFRDRNDRGSNERGGGFREGGGFRDRNDRDSNDRGSNDRGSNERGGGGFRDNRGFRDRNDRGGSRDERGGGGDRFERGEQEESVFSKRVRAGKRRTYFFDVRKTRGNDYFITITESTRREDGFGYKRHKLFLYKEDFNRFVASLNEVVDHVKTELMPEFDYEEFDRRQAEWEAQNRESGEDSHDAESDDSPFEKHSDDRDGIKNESTDFDDFEEKSDDKDASAGKFEKKDDDDVSW